MSDKTSHSALMSTLETIHNEMAQALLKRVKDARADPEKALTASEITAIARFLNDSDIKASQADRDAFKEEDEMPFDPSEGLPSAQYTRR